MRWYWIDRFVEFKSGESATAIKNVTTAEEHLHDHFPGFAVMPNSLLLEGFAQTGGILLGEKNDFKFLVVLAKVPKVTFYSWALPGDTLRYNVKLVDARDEGGTVECVATIGDRLVADGEIVFAHLDPNDPEFRSADQKNWVFRSGLLNILDVGKAGDGSDDTKMTPGS